MAAPAAGAAAAGGTASGLSTASTVGGFVSAGLDAQANALNWIANIVSTRKNRKFQEYMSNTGVSRMSADMQRAGINPLLAGGLGEASTPAGNVINGQLKPDFAEKYLAIENLKLSSAQTAANIAKTEAETANIKESNFILRQEGINKTVQGLEALNNLVTQKLQWRNLKADYEKSTAETAGIKSRNARDAVIADIAQDLNAPLQEIQHQLEGLNPRDWGRRLYNWLHYRDDGTPIDPKNKTILIKPKGRN